MEADPGVAVPSPSTSALLAAKLCEDTPTPCSCSSSSWLPPHHAHTCPSPLLTSRHITHTHVRAVCVRAQPACEGARLLCLPPSPCRSLSLSPSLRRSLSLSYQPGQPSSTFTIGGTSVRPFFGIKRGKVSLKLLQSPWLMAYLPMHGAHNLRCTAPAALLRAALRSSTRWDRPSTCVLLPRRTRSPAR